MERDRRLFGKNRNPVFVIELHHARDRRDFRRCRRDALTALRNDCFGRARKLRAHVISWAASTRFAGRALRIAARFRAAAARIRVAGRAETGCVARTERRNDHHDRHQRRNHAFGFTKLHRRSAFRRNLSDEAQTDKARFASAR